MPKLICKTQGNKVITVTRDAPEAVVCLPWKARRHASCIDHQVNPAALLLSLHFFLISSQMNSSQLQQNCSNLVLLPCHLLSSTTCFSLSCCKQCTSVSNLLIKALIKIRYWKGCLTLQGFSHLSLFALFVTPSKEHLSVFHNKEVKGHWNESWLEQWSTPKPHICQCWVMFRTNDFTAYVP